MRRRPAVTTALAFTWLLAACGGADSSDRDTVASPSNGPTASTIAATGAGGEAEYDAYADGKGVGRDDAAATERLAGPSAPGGDVATPPPISTTLNAGSVDDNEAWEDFLRYRDDFLASGIPAHDVDITNRYVVTVVGDDGRPVSGAQVELRDPDGKKNAARTTYADGRVLMYPPRPSGQDTSVEYDVVVTKGDASATAALNAETREQTITLAHAAHIADPAPVDIVFLLDATGSMGDEIEQLKANMVSVAEQLDKLSPRPDVRFALTSYRDRGDEYVTRTTDFTSDVGEFTETLRGVVANGGGDTPESLNAGLHDALAAPSWRDGDTIKLVFLVADAAPHLDYTDDADYAQEMVTAAERGIKIHPIASSGLDDQGEYVMRQLAQYTTGRFNFLTYGADGVSPGDQTTHHVDDYSVLSLDELVVQLVKDELDALGGVSAPAGSTPTTQAQTRN
ncbi:MAG TPA: vWA domain-containing protein [Acidimicrobiia bacterium]|nr:vWA domain-containing protein [Acidimicrobiia bacterium]